MNIKRLYDFLLTDESKLFYQEIKEKDLTNINLIQHLKSEFPSYPIAELLTLERLRKNALKRIENSDKYLFTTKGVEQSSSSQIATYHAELFSRNSIIADLCCGNGIDLVHIAENKKSVYAIDYSNTALYCSRYNAMMNNLNTIDFLNIKAEEFDCEVDGVFIDPDRRPEERRVIQGDDISPSFNEIIKIIEKFKNVVVKLSPVFDYQLESIAGPHTWEFVSEDRVLKEILLCTGTFATSNILKKAVILPNTTFLENKNSVGITEIKNYVYDPDPAIIRSGLVQDLAFVLDASLINKHLSILTSNNLISSQYVKSYHVLKYFHYSKKTLQKYIYDNQIGKLVIKVRGFPDRPNQILQKLKLKGASNGLVYLIRMDTEFLCLVLDIDG